MVTRGCSASYDGGSACDSAPTITVCYVLFHFIQTNINYLLPRLLNFWKPDTLPRITNCYDVHAYMPQHRYLAFFVYIITVYTSLYYILKHKISRRNNVYVCDVKHRPEHFLFILFQWLQGAVQPHMTEVALVTRHPQSQSATAMRIYVIQGQPMEWPSP